MDEIFTRVWENLVARSEGPMSLRFFFQPAMSLIFAIRAGIKDARQGTVPFLWRLVFSKGKRREVARDGWKHFGTIFIAAIALDIIYQLIVIYKFKSESYFYPLESVITAIVLAIVPYILFRGPISRLITWWYRDRGDRKLGN